MSFWTLSEIKAACGGSWIARPESAPATLFGVSTDTRTIRSGNVFVALKGERFDGHTYLAQAAAAGATLLIIEDPASLESPSTASAPVAILKVPSTRQALLRLAIAYRRTLEHTRIVAVVGANGKTTTTRIIDTLLGTRLKGSASPKSFNNDIGVPLTILNARSADQYLVCEVGTNHPGEIAVLAPVVRPDIVVMTSIGRAHIEHFGSLEAIVREDAAILRELRPGGVAIVPSGEPLVEDAVRHTTNVIRFGRDEHADLRLTSIEPVAPRAGAPGMIRFTLNQRQRHEVPLLGAHNALNATAAIAVARRFGLDNAAIDAGLAAVRPADMRLNRRDVRDITFIVDCYNANPESAAAAIRTFAPAAADAQRRVIVLGDMLELGAHGPDAHREVGRIIAAECPDAVLITVGTLAAHAADDARTSMGAGRVHTMRAGDWAAPAAALLRPGDAVLLKGSRGMALERLIDAVEAAPEHDRRTGAPPSRMSAPAA